MNKENNRYFYLVVLAVGFIFLRSSYGKFTGGTFVSTLGETLSKMVGKNPYPWYKSFLLSTAIPNATTFGLLTMWGELLSGLAMLLAAVYLLIKGGNKLAYLLLALGGLGGAFLNGIFWLAAGYTSSSTDGLNLLMFVIGVLAFWLGLSRLVKTAQ